jgi:catechol 2,3-dioxygenase-like lactoylglutathione lyase family enzyme
MNGDLKINTVVETAIYADDLAAVERFYAGVMGLNVIGKEPDRHVFFRVGEASVLLVFRASVTLNGEPFPPHGATGPGHFALGVDREALEAWRTALTAKGVAIEKEAVWPRGGRSIYFRDPAGNLVELVTPGIWGLPSGW